MRIEKHPILDFKGGRKISFTFDGKKMEGFEGETVTAALVASGVLTLSKSIKLEKDGDLNTQQQTSWVP